ALQLVYSKSLNSFVGLLRKYERAGTEMLVQFHSDGTTEEITDWSKDGFLFLHDDWALNSKGEIYGFAERKILGSIPLNLRDE
ncbi:MAG: hypothetical protein ACR2H1_06495, partial [Limisphaerales bacterium]